MAYRSPPSAGFRPALSPEGTPPEASLSRPPARRAQTRAEIISAYGLHLTVSRALGVWFHFLSSKAVRLFFSLETIAQLDQLPTPIGIADGDSPSVVSPRNHFHVEDLDWHDRTPREVRVDPACKKLSGISSRRKSIARSPGRVRPQWSKFAIDESATCAKTNRWRRVISPASARSAGRIVRRTLISRPRAMPVCSSTSASQSDSYALLMASALPGTRPVLGLTQ